MKPVDLSIDDYQKTVQSFHSESDRAAAVLAGSFIESFIAKFIRSHMIENPEIDLLFDGFGPFSTYSQRVQTAFAFGLISEQDKSDLNNIAKIRNRFAHHPLEASFETSPVSDWCRNLSTYEVFPLPDQDKSLRKDNRHRFIVAVSMLVAGWHNAILSKKEQTSKGIAKA